MGRPKGSLNKNTILKHSVTNVTEPEFVRIASPKKEVPDEIKQTHDDAETPLLQQEIPGELEDLSENKPTTTTQKRKTVTKTPDPPPYTSASVLSELSVPTLSVPTLSDLSDVHPNSDKTARAAKSVRTDKYESARTDKNTRDYEQLRPKRRRTTRKVIILRDSSSSSSSSSSSEEESSSSDEDASGYTVVRGRKKRRRYNRHKHSENSDKNGKTTPRARTSSW